MKCWVGWHAGYDSAGRSLARALQVVKSSLRQALEAARSPSAVVLSLCAGDGRDVIAVLEERPVGVRQAILVELDQTLASRAKQEAVRAELAAVEVRCRDAGTVDSFSDLPPEAAADFGVVAARVERAILGLGDVGRVHVYRWGDGGAHFHVWFLPRPLGMLDATGPMLPLWEDVLPNVPDEELAAAARRVAASMDAA